MDAPDSHGVSRVPCYLGCRYGLSGFRLRGSHPLRPAFPGGSPILPGPTSRSLNPGGQVRRFGLFPVRSPLLGESHLSSFPPGTEMFHFPGLATRPYFVQTPSAGHCPRRVFPFGDLRIKACLPLPGAYRSLPRPSSPADAKASVTRPFELGQNQSIRPS